MNGCTLDPKQNGLIVTLPEHGFSLPALPDYGLYEALDDGAQAGYYALLAPFHKPGKHTIHFTAFQSYSGPAEEAFGSFPFSNDITYYLTVV